MTNKLTKENCGKLGLQWDDLISMEACEGTLATSSWDKKGKHSYIKQQKVIKIDHDYFPTADESVLGFWQTSWYTIDYYDGVQWDEIEELTRVVEQEVVEYVWKEV